MFSKLNDLVNSLFLSDKTSYKECKEARKVLQEIKKEAQLLRFNITEEFKKSKKEPKVKKEKVVEKVFEEPVLVDEDTEDFINKQ